MKNYVLIETIVTGYDLNDYQCLIENILDGLDIVESIEFNLPVEPSEITYFLYQPNEEEIESEGECLFRLWSIVEINPAEKDNLIPDWEQPLCDLSLNYDYRIACYIIDKELYDLINSNYSSSKINIYPEFDLIEKSQGRWQWYIDGGFDEGEYM